MSSSFEPSKRPCITCGPALVAALLLISDTTAGAMTHNLLVTATVLRSCAIKLAADGLLTLSCTASSSPAITLARGSHADVIVFTVTF